MIWFYISYINLIVLLNYTNLIAIIFYVINKIKLYSHCKVYLLWLVVNCFFHFRLIVDINSLRILFSAFFAKHKQIIFYCCTRTLYFTNKIFHSFQFLRDFFKNHSATSSYQLTPPIHLAHLLLAHLLLAHL